MKFSKIALAVAAAFAAGQAFAGVTPAQIVSARDAGTLDTTWISGASASAVPATVAAFTGCDSGSATVLTQATSGNTLGSLGNYMAYACTVTSGTPAKTRTRLVYHSIDGGSATAYKPHTDGWQLDRLAGNIAAAGKRYAYNVTDSGVFVQNATGTSTAGCTINASGLSSSVLVNIPGGAADLYNSCAMEGQTGAAAGANLGKNGAAVAALALPEGGLSDVEAALFGIDANSIGSEAPANFTQVFGVAVNPKLYRALQIKQGIYPAGTVFGNTTLGVAGVDADFDPANAPNITTAEYVSIANSSGNTHTDWSPILGSAGAGKKVYLERRVNTSGTQASSNAFFLNAPCATADGILGAQSPADKDNDGTTNFVISHHAGTGNVKAGLTTRDNAGDFAIGVVSLENDWRTETSVANVGYRFLKVNGVHPETSDTDGTLLPTTVVKNGSTTVSTNTYAKHFARTTAASAAYQFAYETVAFTKTGASATGVAIMNLLATKIGNPPSCSKTPRGLLLLPAGGSTCTTYANATTTDLPEVGRASRVGNSCSPLFF